MHHDTDFLWAIAAIFGLVIFLNYWLEKKRREALKRVAASLGMRFAASSVPGFLGQVAEFHLGNQGHSRSARNLIEGNYQGAVLTVFDYSYTIGGGKNRTTYTQTVVMFSLEGASRMPEFTVRPENFFDKVATVFGHVDINFERDEAFSKSYRLHGKDEAAVRLIFDDAARRYLVRNPDLCVEASGRGMVMYRRGVCVKPEGLRSFLDKSMELLTQLARQAGQ